MTINAQLRVFCDKVAVHNAAAVRVLEDGGETVGIVALAGIEAEHLLVRLRQLQKFSTLFVCTLPSTYRTEWSTKAWT